VDAQLNEAIIHKSLRGGDFLQGTAVGILGSFGGFPRSRRFVIGGLLFKVRICNPKHFKKWI